MSDIVERLRTRNGRADGFGLGAVCDEAADEIERLRKDAERYRALRRWADEQTGALNGRAHVIIRRPFGLGPPNDGKQLDAAIDAAMQAKEGA